jgi:hypothetical protein
MEELKQYIKDFKIEHPLFAIEAEDLYCLCVAEIEQGGSKEHEINLCYSSLDDLLTYGEV